MTLAGLPAFGANAPPIDPRAAARLILAERRFAHRNPLQQTTWWDRLGNWLGGEWDRFVQAFGHNVHVAPGVSVLFGDLLVAAAAILVIAVLVRLLSLYARERSDAAAAVPIAGRLTARTLYQQSVTAEANGRYALAVTLLFRASLAALDVRGVVHDDPSFTVNECRRQIGRGEQQFIAPFDALARIFSDVLYADTPVSRESWLEARRAYAQLAPHAVDAA